MKLLLMGLGLVLLVAIGSLLNGCVYDPYVYAGVYSQGLVMPPPPVYVAPNVYYYPSYTRVYYRGYP